MIDEEKPALDIRHDQAEQRFTLEIGEAGRAELKYRILEREGVDVMDFTHTFVPEEVRNRGIGRAIVKNGLQYAREKGYKVRGACPFVKKFLDEHPGYEDIRDRGGR